MTPRLSPDLPAPAAGLHHQQRPPPPHGRVLPRERALERAADLHLVSRAGLGPGGLRPGGTGLSPGRDAGLPASEGSRKRRGNVRVERTDRPGSRHMATGYRNNVVRLKCHGEMGDDRELGAASCAQSVDTDKPQVWQHRQTRVLSALALGVKTFGGGSVKTAVHSARTVQALCRVNIVMAFGKQ